MSGPIRARRASNDGSETLHQVHADVIGQRNQTIKAAAETIATAIRDRSSVSSTDGLSHNNNPSNDLRHDTVAGSA